MRLEVVTEVNINTAFLWW